MRVHTRAQFDQFWHCSPSRFWYECPQHKREQKSPAFCLFPTFCNWFTCPKERAFFFQCQPTSSKTPYKTWRVQGNMESNKFSQVDTSRWRHKTYYSNKMVYFSVLTCKVEGRVKNLNLNLGFIRFEKQLLKIKI